MNTTETMAGNLQDRRYDSPTTHMTRKTIRFFASSTRCFTFTWLGMLISETQSRINWKYLKKKNIKNQLKSIQTLLFFLLRPITLETNQIEQPEAQDQAMSCYKMNGMQSREGKTMAEKRRTEFRGNSTLRPLGFLGSEWLRLLAYGGVCIYSLSVSFYDTFLFVQTPNRIEISIFQPWKSHFHIN